MGKGYFNKLHSVLLITVLLICLVHSVVALSPTLNSLRLNEDLLVYYPFSEGEGTIAEDYGNTNRNGAISGATWYQDGENSALEFDGDDAVVIDPPPDLTSYELTISVFAQYYSYYDEWSHAIIAQDTFDYPDRVFQLSTRWGAITWHRFGSPDITTEWSVDLYKWYHIIAVYKKGVHQLWVDGVQIGVVAGDIIASTEIPVTIGWVHDGGIPFEGLIDEVRIYNRGLERTEIAELFDIGRNGPLNDKTIDDEPIAEFNLSAEDLKWLRYLIFGLAVLALTLMGINTVTHVRKN